MSKIAIIGSGISGIGAAEILSKHKKKFIIFEKNKYIGGHQLTIDINNYDYLHVSFDIDALDPTLTPSTGTPVNNGLGKSCFKSTSVCLTLIPFVSFHLWANLWIWVSTGKAGTPKACDITPLAVLWPTPGSDSSSSNELGTSPENLDNIILDNKYMFLDFVLERPNCLIISYILLCPSLHIDSGLFANLKRLGVISFTFLSVHWALSNTATSRVKLFEWFRGIGVRGYNASSVCKI